METTKEEVAMDVSGRGDVVLDLELGPEEDLLESDGEVESDGDGDQ